MCNTGRPLNLHFPHVRQSAEATKIKKKLAVALRTKLTN